MFSHPRIRACSVTLIVCVVAAGSARAQDDGPTRKGLVERIEAAIAEALEQPGAVGFSVAVAVNGEIILAGGYGLAEVEHDVAADGDTLFRIGSVTKQFTAACIMKLVEEGKLALDDELAKFFPDFPTHGKTITVRHLLTHTSGIKSYTGVPAFWQESVARELTVDELLAYVKDEPLEFEPGAQFAYNNTAYYMLGPIAEQTAGMPYCEYLESEVLAPLGLKHTRCDSNATIIPGRAQGYAVDDDGALVNDGLIGMDNPGAAGMMLATARDLVTWKLALLDGTIVSPESVAQMLTPFELNDGTSTGYGFGLRIDEPNGRKRIGHGGGIYGFNSVLTCFPDDGLCVAVISNSEEAPSQRLARRITRAVARSGAPAR